MANFEGKPIGFVGLGIMGKPMARNLARAGYDLVIYNRSQDDIDTLLGEGNQFQAAGSPREVAERTNVIITVLPDSPDVHDVVFGANGLLPAVGTGHLLID
nr:NAD(P)-binding domain-containing protein [Chloroflexia bacterium]